jgi:hypothetical protein
MTKKEIIKAVVIFICVPTVLAGAWYGGKFIKKKWDEKKKNDDNNARKVGTGSNDVVDTSGMTAYEATIPFKYQPKLFTNGEFPDAVKGVGYVMDIATISDDKKNPVSIKVTVKANPSDLPKLKEILDSLKSEITIEEKKV